MPAGGPDHAAVQAEIEAAQRQLHEAILAKDRAALEDFHDEEFFAAELPGELISAEQHVETAMNAEGLELEPFEITVKGFGDLAIEWNKQTLRGRMQAEDPGTSPTIAAAVRDGVVFSCLTVWRRRDGKWRLLSYQATLLAGEDAQTVDSTAG
jgi:ketosteroid isomerase-like protein